MTERDLGVYVLDISEPVFRYHFNELVGPARNSWTYYSEREQFINSQHSRRVACFQIPYPYNASIEQEIDAVYDHVDTIIVLGSELHARTVDFMRRYDRAKVHWFVCGLLTQKLQYSQVHPFMDWFTTSVHFYKNVRPSTLYSLNPYQSKPLMFDALLGRKKRHRDQAHNFIQTHQLDQQGIVTYFDSHETNFAANDTRQWLWESEGLEGQDNVEWTVDMVKYYGHTMSLSQVIPISVYNQTAYSLVCETNVDNDYIFYTEKTVKPILARRLFITLSHRYALAGLRDLGFRTFDGIIDERYDSIVNPVERHTAALEQLRWLCLQDQHKILEQARPIVEHNFNLMYGRNWYEDFCRVFGRVLFNR
jgi:hypothetical protein